MMIQVGRGRRSEKCDGVAPDFSGCVVAALSDSFVVILRKCLLDSLFRLTFSLGLYPFVQLSVHLAVQ